MFIQALDAGSLAQPIDISSLPQGFYAWQIVLNNNTRYETGKLTVHR